MDLGDTLSLSLSFPICNMGITIVVVVRPKDLEHLDNVRHRNWHSLVLDTWALEPAPLMARSLNLSGPLFSQLQNGDNFTKPVVRTN